MNEIPMNTQSQNSDLNDYTVVLKQKLEDDIKAVEYKYQTELQGYVKLLSNLNDWFIKSLGEKKIIKEPL